VYNVDLTTFAVDAVNVLSFQAEVVLDGPREPGELKIGPTKGKKTTDVGSYVGVSPL
jgi:hypothetical protein